MSHSSLSAQLASLNASAAGGKNVGSTLGSSKRHEDAVGRGLAHSATHGHALASTTSPHFKPSVLYADSREASDVPLTTLRENCVSCLGQLARDTLNDAFVKPEILQSLVGTHSLSYERGLATRAENDKLDETIISLLSLLSTAMGESSVSCFQSSLHVIEYLLRRYDIHSRANTAESLLLTTLPHHEQPVFLRILQLVDLASFPTWVFLRPHAQKGAPQPTRTLLAKRAAHDNALVLHCCKMAKSAAKIHADECNTNNAAPLSASRRGISRIISFAAAVIVEALSIQTTIPTNQGSIAEPTLRCIFPFVLNACGDSKSSTFSLGVQCPDWRGFGHVLAATISEKSVLAADVRQVLCTTIVKGALETDRALNESGATGKNDHVQVAADFVLALMTVLSNAENSDASTLEVLVPSRNDNVERRIGYDLAPATYRVLAKHKWLTQALGCLNDDRDISVAPLLASILTMAMEKVLNETSTRSKKTSTSSNLILELIQEKSLETVWTNVKVNLSASFVSALVIAFANKKEEQEDAPSLDSARSILDALRAVNSTGCDTGIAHAVTVACSKGGGKGSRSSRKKRVALLLGLPSAGSNKTDGDDGDSDRSRSNLDSALLLPPRVALEHPEAAVRLNAIERVMDEVTGMDVEETGESLELTFLRRVITDENVGVAAAAGRALVTLLKARNAKSLEDAFADMAVDALCKWSVFKDENVVNGEASGEKSKKKKKRSKKEKHESAESSVVSLSEERLEVLDSVLSIASYAVRSFIQHGDDETMANYASLPLLIQAMAAHLDFGLANDDKQNQDAETIVSSASKALQFAFGHKPKKKTKGFDAAKTILTNELCSLMLRNVCSSASIPTNQNSTMRALQKRYLWVMVATLSDAKDALDAFAASLHILSSYHDGNKSSNIKEFEASALLKSLRFCAKEIASRETETVPDIIISLSSIPSSKAYEQVCSPAIQDFCRSVAPDKGYVVSPIVVIMEAASRFDVSDDAVERLVSVASDFVLSHETRLSSMDYASGVIPAMLLSGHEEQKIRKTALDLLAKIAQRLDGDTQSAAENDYIALKDLCKLCAKEQGGAGMYSSLLMDGESALPKVVTKALQVSKEPSRLRVSLIRHCLLASTAHRRASSSGETELGWLSFGRARGGCRAAASVLKALEYAGEAAFPLSLRWENAGKQIFRELLHLNFATEEDARLGITQLQELIDSVVTMLKGVLVIDASSLDQHMSNVLISSGPSQKGRRSRSYSVGRVDGVAFMEPYLNDMYIALVGSISSPFCDTIGSNSFARELCDAVVQNVFTRSWGDGIFKEMSSEQRRTIESSLLYLRTTQDLTSAGLALLGLPMDASDILLLLRDAQKADGYLFALTFLCDWIRLNSSYVTQDPGSDEVVSILFEILGALSSTSGPSMMETDDVDGAEFARMSILQTLVSLSQATRESNKEISISRKKRKEMASLVSLLVRLVGGGVENGTENNLSFLPLVSGRAKSTAISLLTSLCSYHPAAVVGSLIPALLSTMVSSASESGELIRASRSAGAAFMGVVPVFCRHASSADLSLLNLLSAFILECQRLHDKQDRLILYRNLVAALVSVQPVDKNGHSVGSLLGVYVASQVFKSRTKSDVESGEKDDFVAFSLDVLRFAPPAEQVASLLQLLRFVSQSFIELGATETGEISTGGAASKSAMDVGFEDIVSITFFGANGINEPSKSLGEYSLEQRQCIMDLTTGILTVIQEALSTGVIRKFIKKSDDAQSELCLRLWQEMLCIQAAAVDAQTVTLNKLAISDNEKHDEISSFANRFFELSKHAIGETLECLQNLLPAHLFLASATSLINEDSTSGELRAKAIRLVAERAIETEPNSVEATLFLDIVPLLIELLSETSSVASVSKNETKMLLQQSSLIAIEHLARALCLPSSTQGGADKNASMFLKALGKVTTILDDKSCRMQKVGNASAADNASIQLLCSAALCAATLVRTLKARCLPLLPKIVDPLLETLSATNEHLLSGAGEMDQKTSTAKVLQLSTLHAIVAVADTLPQFLLPYLGKLLSPSGLPSRALRTEEEEQDIALAVAIEQLETTLSSRTPARQLVPAVCKASSDCKGQYEEFQAMLSILEMAIQHASRGELPTLTSWVLKTLMMAYEHDGSGGDQIPLFSAANKVLLALVFKLSEAQLRNLYAKLREWRREFEKSSKDKIVASKRLAFWSLSSVLSKELRTIFLPCLSTVVSDAVEELEFAVSRLSATKSSEKLAGGKKKRRLVVPSSDGENDDDMESLRTLQPVLACLESALKADAHEGGSWARADDGQRYNSLLSPLGKLLQSRIPANFPVVVAITEKSNHVSGTPFQQVVEGVGGEENGNVIGCLTALASAAGNEQLWKPLNHAVLEACDNEGRSEVRKAGISCLLSLIKTLGEEYMVLLPECLPVLSELLEDGDEDIAALAQECVSLGEDLLGESLQDSLR